MFKIKSVRPGILVIPDASLKLRNGETVERAKLTRQIQAAVDKGFLEVETLEGSASGSSETVDGDKGAEPLSSLTANEAIARVNSEKSPEVLQGLIDSEKRKSVLDALKHRLQEVNAGGTE